jgi:hypothetical protein
MKSTELKKLIKESVREAISEELKDILLEVVKSKTSTTTITPPPLQKIEPTEKFSPPSLTESEKRQKYQEIISGMARGQDTLSFNSNNAQNMGGEFKPKGKIDSINGSLPEGEVSMNQIMDFIK